MGLFREILQIKIRLETAQNPPKDHLSDEVNNIFSFLSVVIFTNTQTAVTSHYHFNATSGRLLALYNDLDTSMLTFTYTDSGMLERVTSSEGYELRVQYNSAGHVDSVTLYARGEAVSFATYVSLSLQKIIFNLR